VDFGVELSDSRYRALEINCQVGALTDLKHGRQDTPIEG
jgi:hypothetical protein